MKKAAPILCSVGFVLGLLQSMVLIFASAFGFVIAVFGSNSQPDMDKVGMIVGIVAGIFGVLGFAGSILLGAGRTTCADGNLKRGSVIIIVAGALSLCPPTLIGGIFYRILAKQPPVVEPND